MSIQLGQQYEVALRESGSSFDKLDSPRWHGRTVRRRVQVTKLGKLRGQAEDPGAPRYVWVARVLRDGTVRRAGKGQWVRFEHSQFEAMVRATEKLIDGEQRFRAGRPRRRCQSKGRGNVVSGDAMGERVLRALAGSDGMTRGELIAAVKDGLGKRNVTRVGHKVAAALAQLVRAGGVVVVGNRQAKRLYAAAPKEETK